MIIIIKENINIVNYEEYLKKINSTQIFKKFYFNYNSEITFITKAKSHSLYEKSNISHKRTTVSDENKNDCRTLSDISDDNDNNIFILE